MGKALQQKLNDLKPRDPHAKSANQDREPSSTSSLQRAKDFVIHWERSRRRNLFGTVSITTEVTQLGRSRDKDFEDLENDDFIRTTSLSIRPAEWLFRLGLGFCLQIGARESSQGWKCSLEAPRAVPNDAPIFSACKSGHLDKVKRLCADGQASVWDTDEVGQTPLEVYFPLLVVDISWVVFPDAVSDQSASSLHSRIVVRTSAAFSSWKQPARLILPIFPRCNASYSIALSPLLNVFSHPSAPSLFGSTSVEDRQIDTLRLFLDQIDLCTETAASDFSWRVLYSLLQHSRIRTFEWLFRISILGMAGPFNRHALGILVWFLPDNSEWQTLFVSILSALDKENIELSINVSWFISQGKHVEAPLSELIRLGANVHPRYFGPSPTAIAMRSSLSFHHWRNSLLLAFIDLEDFVRQECQHGSVAEAGWNEDTLLALFRLDQRPARQPCDVCFRCSVVRSPHDRKVVAVEIGWQLDLERLKAGVSNQAGIEKATTDPNVERDRKSMEDSMEDSMSVDDAMDDDGEQRQSKKGIHCPCVQHFSFVCYYCWLELLDHEHVDESADTTSSSSSELSDWEDSMFLLSI